MPPPWQQHQVQESIQHLWSKWRAFKQVRKQGLRGWFQAWRAWKAFDKQYRTHQKRCKQARRAVLLQAMEEAELHARTHNSRGLYQIIKRLAPKQARKRMQLRGQDGQMLTPDQELSLLTQHFSQRFKAEQPEDVEMATRTWEGRGDFPLDAATLCHYIQQVPRRKAVPQGHPPSVSWRLCADLISPWLCDVLHRHWVTPALQVPRAWTDVDLALVPKPDRTGRNPQDHRPIGLACPLGKKFLGALLQPHVPGIIEQIQIFPQFAYQQGRSQFAALRRVYQHCSSVREQLQKHTRNLHQRFAGAKAVPLYGALMLTVDLAQAFDRMPRSKLYQGLCRLQLPQDLIHILMAWHSSIHYHIHHHQNTSSFRASQGIRQGCSVAPLLWLVFTHEVCCALADKVGKTTLLRILTMFADDFLLADSFTSLAELEHLLDVIAVLFRTLETFGMQVSAQKSKAILVLRGTLRNTVHRKFVRPDPSGEGMALRMHTSSGALNVPLTDCFTYLGARVSYSHFERQTLEWRLAKGEAAFQRLGKVLKGQHHLTAHQRLRLWQACVWTTTQYGLTASGLPPAGIQRLETFVVRQLRAVLRLPAHITRTTNEEVCSAANFPLPHVALQNLLCAEGARISAAPADPFVCAPADSWWKQIHSTLDVQVQHGITHLDPGLCEAQSCPHCGVTYHTRAALKTHLAKQHQDLLGETTGVQRPCFSKTADSQDGLPKCRHCKKHFPTWQLLERHIIKGYCRVKPLPAPNPDAADELSLQSGPSTVADVKLAHHPDLLHAFSTYRVNAVLHISERHRYMQRCLLCGQWVASPAVMKTHYEGSHPHAFKLSSKATQLCSSFSSAGSPCIYCGTHTKQPRHHKQQCSVLWQFCLLAANRGDSALPGRTVPVASHGGEQSRTGAQGTIRPLGEHPGGCVRTGAAGLGKLDAGNGATQSPTSGQQEEGPNSRKQPTLTSFWAGRQQTERGTQRGSTVSGSRQVHGQADHSSRNQPAGPKAEFCLGRVLAAGTARTTSHVVQGLGGVPEGGQKSPHGMPAAGPAASHALPNHADLYHQPEGQCWTDPSSSGQRMVDTRRPLGLPAVGPANSGSDSGQQPSAPRLQGTAHPSVSHGPGGTSEGCGSQVQCHSPAGGGPEGNGEVHAGDWASGRRSDGCMEGLGSSSRAGSPADRGHAVEARWSSALQPGGGRTANAGRTLGLILNNPTQHCYINSFVLAWLWTFGNLEAPEAQFFGEYAQAWRDILHSSTPVTVYRTASWTRLFRGWRAPASQHDAADFITHVMTRMQPLALQGVWQSRLGVSWGQADVIDSGSLLSPIVLHLSGNGEEEDLQGCIDRWHRQAYLHGLCQASPVVLLQLARYSYGAGGAAKDRSGVSIPRKLFLPIFGRGLNVFQATYSVLNHCASWYLYKRWTLYFFAPGAGRPAQEHILGNG